MPPAGIGLHVARAVAEARVEVTARTIRSFLENLVLATGLIAFIPWITLAVRGSPDIKP